MGAVHRAYERPTPRVRTSRCPRAARSLSIWSASATERVVSIAARAGVISPCSRNASRSSRSLLPADASPALRSEGVADRLARPLTNRPKLGKTIQPKTKTSQNTCGMRDRTRITPSATGASTVSAAAIWARGLMFSASRPKKLPDFSWCLRVSRRAPNFDLFAMDDLPHIIFFSFACVFSCHYVSRSNGSPLARMPEHGPVRRSAGGEGDSGPTDIETELAVPGNVSLGHGLQVAVLPRLIGQGEDRLEEPRADAEPLRGGLDADHLEVPVGLRGMQPSHAGNEPQEPGSRSWRRGQHAGRVGQDEKLSPGREWERARRQPGRDPDDLAAECRRVDVPETEGVAQARSLQARQRAGAGSRVREEVDQVRALVEAAGEDTGGLRQPISRELDHADIGGQIGRATVVVAYVHRLLLSTPVPGRAPSGRFRSGRCARAAT